MDAALRQVQAFVEAYEREAAAGRVEASAARCEDPGAAADAEAAWQALRATLAALTLGVATTPTDLRRAHQPVVRILDADRIAITHLVPGAVTYRPEGPPQGEPTVSTLTVDNTSAKILGEALLHAAAEDIVRRELVRDGHPSAGIGRPTGIEQPRAGERHAQAVTDALPGGRLPTPESSEPAAAAAAATPYQVALAAAAAKQDRRRERRSAAARPAPPCGTWQAGERHYSRHEPLDQACRAAYNAHQGERRATARRIAAREAAIFGEVG